MERVPDSWFHLCVEQKNQNHSKFILKTGTGGSFDSEILI
jgi:hypothetical protein